MACDRLRVAIGFEATMQMELVLEYWKAVKS